MADLKTTNIKGKEYVEVSERIRYFRESEEFKDWSLETEIISIENGQAVLKGIIKDEQGRIRATGIAYEKEGSSFINKTSYIENCETSAWGRALGNLGIGIEGSVASALEVLNAIDNQEKSTKTISDAQLKRLWAIASSHKLDLKKVTEVIAKDYKKTPQQLTKVEYDAVIARIEKAEKK